MVSFTNTDTENANALNRMLSYKITINWEVTIYIVILLLAVFTRFYGLGDRVMSHDESLHTRFSYNLYKDGNFEHTPLMHGPVLFHMTAFSYFLFGDNDFTSRIYPALLGVALIMMPFLFRRWLGRWGAILASIMLLISPLLLYYNRYIRHDTPSIFFAMVMAYAILMYINGPPGRQRRAYWLYLLAGAMILNLGSKETSFLYIAIFLSFLLFYFFMRLAQRLWDVRAKAAFYTLMIGILFGGVLTLAMYVIVDIIPVMILPGRGTPFADLPPIEQRSMILWTLLSIAAVILVAFSTMFWAFRHRLSRVPWGRLGLVLLIAFVTCIGLLIIEEFSHTAVSETPVAAVPGENGDVTDTETVESTISWLPMIATWVGTVVVLIFLFWSKRTSIELGRKRKDEDEETPRGIWAFLEQFPEFDVLVIMTTLVLPWATAVVPYVMRPSSGDFIAVSQSLPQFAYNIIFNIPNIGTPDQVGQFILGGLAWLPLMTISVVVGLMWNWRRWLVAAAIFHLIFAFFFTTVFTNIAGLGSGMIYSLGYWLEQQGVRRGSQPQYYYVAVIMPFYEFLPIIGSVLAMFAGTVLFWRKMGIDQDTRSQVERMQIAALLHEDDEQTSVSESAVSTEEADEGESELLPQYQPIFETRDPDEGYLNQIPVLLLIAWWAILNLVGYSLAGEKMPWLGTHLTTPMILLTGWYFGRIVSRIELKHLLNRGWVLLIVLPLLTITVLQVAAPFWVGAKPFEGLQQAQLERTYSWLAVVGVSAALIFVVYRLSETTGWRHVRRMFGVTMFILLSIITFRSAWMAAFINHDYATEFLVYAHAAPAIKWVLDDIEELSLRITDGRDLKFVYDNEVSWPYSWYFRDYNNAVFVGANPTVQATNDAIVVVVGDGNRGKVEPIVEDRYQRFEHMRLWWPMQEYFNLTADRLVNAFDISPDNPNAAAIRQGMFDIWWSRDYSTYGEAINKDFNVTNWPVSDRMYVYVRKDFAAQIWPYGVGDGEVQTNFPDEVNLCTANWIQQDAIAVFDAPSPLNRPLDIAIGEDGQVYVAEEYGNRISVFDTEGNYITALGVQTGGETSSILLNRPNGVAIAPDGSVYISDTWNYRVQVVSQDGESLVNWGQAGEFGFEAPVLPDDGFWGPRDVALDAQGRIYVSDTGNKRIRVYSLDGTEATHLYDLGTGGSGPGQLDEPGGVLIHPDGRVFVADTWNRRISIFDDAGSFDTTFTVKGWYDEHINRPYLALDVERDFLYVTDPDSGRVLVYDTAGNCKGAFGQAGDETPSLSQFSAIGGIAVDADGFVYVTDSTVGRILKFAPFEVPAPEIEVPDAEVTAELEGQSNAEELTAEVTEEDA